MTMKNDEVVILKHDLRALLHWAIFGIAHAKHGAYQDAKGIAESYSKAIKFKPSFHPEWGKFLK